MAIKARSGSEAFHRAESLTDVGATEWRTILATLKRARLISEEDPHNPGHLDTHPLVREYYGEQPRSQRTEAWKECNKRLYDHYRTLAPQLPDSFREMEPLFLAVACGCNAGFHHEALHEIYIPRIQRGDASFASNVLGARGALLSILAHFFEHQRWGSPVQKGVEGQSLTAEDKLFILMQAGLHLTATQGFSAPEARICYERAESLCRSINRPHLLYSALMGRWRYSLVTDKLIATLQVAKRIYSLAQEQNDTALLLGAYRVLAATLYFQGDFETSGQYAMRGVQLWRSGGAQSPVEEIAASPVACLCYQVLTAIGGEETQIETSFCEAIRIAREQKSDSLEKRAEATYAEYRRQKASASEGRGFRLPLW